MWVNVRTKSGSRNTPSKAIETLWTEAGSGSSKSVNSGYSEKKSSYLCILKVQPKGFPHRLDVGSEQEEGVKNNARFFNQRNWEEGAFIKWDGYKKWDRFSEKSQEFSFGHSKLVMFIRKPSRGEKVVIRYSEFELYL